MQTPELLDYEKQAIRDFVDALPDSNLPWRRPSYNDPTFWSEPLVSTSVRPLGGASPWTTMLTIQGNLAYTAYVNGYVATTFGDASLSDVDFRLVLNGQLPTGMSLATNVELFKTGAAAFPVIPRDTSFVIRFDDMLQIQARNNNAAPRLIVSGFFGWNFDDSNPAEKNMREGLTDA